MVVLRRTAKLSSILPLSGSATAVSGTALGDWNVNRIVVDRRPLLLLVSANALLPSVLPARDVQSLPERLPECVAARLRRLRIPTAVIVAPTNNRSVVGIMVDFAKGVPFHLDPGAWDDTSLPFVEARLAETPCHAGRRFDEVIFPEQKAPELLLARWGAG